jgi:hypothetical protein
MIGFRHEVGGDWGTYLRIFEQYRYEEFVPALTSTDPGYALLNWAAQRLGAGIWLVNLVCAAIFTWGFTKLIRREPNPWLCLVVAVPYLIIVVAMGYTRQAVSIGFILAGITHLRDRQSIFRFAFFILLAALFHRSAIVVLPLAAFAATRNRFATLAIGVLMALMLYEVFVRSTVDVLMQNYESQDYDSEGAALRLSMNLVPATLLLCLQKRFGLSELERSLWRNFAIAAFALMALLFIVQSSTAVDRIALYLIPLQVIVLSRLPNVFATDGRVSSLAKGAVIVYSATILFVWLNYAAHSEYWLPYSFSPLIQE